MNKNKDTVRKEQNSFYLYNWTRFPFYYKPILPTRSLRVRTVYPACFSIVILIVWYFAAAILRGNEAPASQTRRVVKTFTWRMMENCRSLIFRQPRNVSVKKDLYFLITICMLWIFSSCGYCCQSINREFAVQYGNLGNYRWLTLESQCALLYILHDKPCSQVAPYSL